MTCFILLVLHRAGPVQRPAPVERIDPLDLIQVDRIAGAAV
jgi:hypothetical protein